MRKPRSDKGQKRQKRSTAPKKQKVIKKQVRKKKAVKEIKQEEVKMPKTKLDSQEFPMLAKFVAEGYADEAIKFLEALKAGMVVTAAEETEEDEAEEETVVEKVKAKKEVVEDEDDDDDDADEEDEKPKAKAKKEDDEDEEDEDEDEEDEDEKEESEDSEDEIEVDLDKVDSMDKEKLVELAEKIGIKKAEKMKEKELRAEIIKKVKELQGETAETEAEDDEDEETDEKPVAKKWAVGDKVLAHYAGDGKYYKAIIKAITKDGKFEVKWKDGDTKHTVSSAVKERTK